MLEPLSSTKTSRFASSDLTCYRSARSVFRAAFDFCQRFFPRPAHALNGSAHGRCADPHPLRLLPPPTGILQPGIVMGLQLHDGTFPLHERAFPLHPAGFRRTDRPKGAFRASAK